MTSKVRVAQWIARLPPKEKAAGSNPASGTFMSFKKTKLTPWRNGNASDSRPEDWGFDSLWGQLLHAESKKLQGRESRHRSDIPRHYESSDSLVVMTSALHAEGREFNPRSEHVLSKSKFLFLKAIKKWAQWGLNP